MDDQTIDEFQARMDALVNKQMDETFEIGYHKLDRNVQKYLRIVLKNYLILNRTIEIDACGSYVGNIQNVLEAIIKLDFEKMTVTIERSIIPSNTSLDLMEEHVLISTALKIVMII